MPPVVKVSAYAGILLWFLMFAMFGINLLTGPPEGTSLADRDFDKVAAPISLALSFGGIAVSVGMLRARVWAYRIFVAGLGLVAMIWGVVALAGKEFSPATLGAGMLCALAVLFRQLLVGNRVRAFFGLASKHHSSLSVPGLLSLVMGLLSLTPMFWPQPFPLFGMWLQRWQDLIISLLFGAGYLALGWGMLKTRRWTWPLAISLTLYSLLYSAGWAWDPNPLNRFGPEEAMTGWTVLKGTVFSLAWSGWTLWRIWLHRRDSLPSDRERRVTESLEVGCEMARQRAKEVAP